MPPPVTRLNVAVYDFQDLTGQNKSSFGIGFAEFSRAITQGASAILVDALKTAGNGCWFNVVERGYLDSLLRERKLIQDTYAFLKKNPKKLIDPLKFADYIVTGGVVSYDSPIASGAATVSVGNYGGGLSGHRDLVTINIRLVRVRDGLVLRSVNASRPILTGGVSGTATRVVGSRILDAQGSLGIQEATQTAVREAIEVGVYELIRQGVEGGIWTRRAVSPYPDANETGSLATNAGRALTDQAPPGRLSVPTASPATGAGARVPRAAGPPNPAFPTPEVTVTGSVAPSPSAPVAPGAYKGSPAAGNRPATPKPEASDPRNVRTADRAG
ncbi:CsgG/HfaB family protein [Methylobacterium sp. A54F]